MSKKKTPEEWIHGTNSTYTNHKCRCELCKEAARQYNRERLKNPEVRQRSLERGKRWQDVDPERYRQKNKRQAPARKAWRARNPDKSREIAARYNLRAKLRECGLTEEEYLLIFNATDGRCAICRSPDNRRLSIDHCHNSGSVRGLLCRKCNMGLGCFSDDPEILKRAIAYLEE